MFNNLDVALNVFSGREHTRRLLGLSSLDKKRMHDEAEELLDGLKIDIISPKLLVEKTSGGQRQIVAAARAMGFQAKILIMDEPTAALGVKEASILLKVITELREQGLSIILITQWIPDVLTVGDRVMVLKAVERQGVLEVDQCTLEDVVNLIIRGRADQEMDYLSFG